MTVYGIITEAGNSFVIEQFKNNEMVVIKFGSMTIPFDAANFNTAWNNAGGAAI